MYSANDAKMLCVAISNSRLLMPLESENSKWLISVLRQICIVHSASSNTVFASTFPTDTVASFQPSSIHLSPAKHPDHKDQWGTISTERGHRACIAIILILNSITFENLNRTSNHLPHERILGRPGSDYWKTPERRRLRK